MIKKFFDHKIWAVLAAGLTVVMLVILAAGLENTQFQPGLPLAQAESSEIQITAAKIAEKIISIPLWKQVVLGILVFLSVVMVSALFPPEWRKKILKYFLRYALFVLALVYLVKNFRSLFPAFNVNPAGAQNGSAPAVGDVAPPVFTPPTVPPVLLYLISLVVILALGGFAFLISRWWLQKQRIQKSPQPLLGLAEVARSSLADISSGKNWKDVIINCYARMSDVVDTQRGLRRRTDLTASEFASRLERAGLPGDAVLRLTRLFEAVRYGGRNASRAEMAEAITCLTIVLHACGVSE
jgi:hypothetical protein